MRKLSRKRKRPLKRHYNNKSDSYRELLERGFHQFFSYLKDLALENATFEPHIKEPCDVINQRPNAFTENSCEGHPFTVRSYEGHYEIPLPFPSIQGYAKTKEEFQKIERSARRSGLMCERVKHGWISEVHPESAEEFYCFDIRPTSEVDRKEGRKRFKAYAKWLEQEKP